jgi:rSAM/selenodomain-associated transferase 1
MKKALLTFVKAPVPGTVKTRLQADMGADRTVEVYKAFIRETLFRCSRLSGLDRFLGCAPSRNHAFLREIAETYAMPMFNQRGSDLGKRIVNAFKDFFKKGYSDIVLIGSDSPTIPGDYIKKAFGALKQNDFVVGPCCDGGMYLVGARKTIEPDVFKNIPWDTSEVLNLVLANLFSRNVRFSMLPFWYDVDNIDDMKFLELHLKYLGRKLSI